ncbi:hypothetical protein BDB01DRAFT_835777 [Pilobolus umbonatus]|nr:hypothetical protein BDB01DRAFT_835777 [Pilobolus umbonatus]
MHINSSTPANHQPRNVYTLKTLFGQTKIISFSQEYTPTLYSNNNSSQLGTGVMAINPSTVYNGNKEYNFMEEISYCVKQLEIHHKGRPDSRIDEQIKKTTEKEWYNIDQLLSITVAVCLCEVVVMALEFDMP